jgi:tetratricopeptide (TPR) repeat protein
VPVTDREPTAQELAEALAYYEKALERTPDDDIMWMLYGNALCAAQRWGDAVRAYERAAGQKQSLPEVQYHLGVARMASGDYHGAVDAFDRHLMRSEDVEVLVLASLCLDVEDERKRSRAYFERAMRKDATRAMAYLREYARELVEADGGPQEDGATKQGLTQAIGHIDEYLEEKAGKRPKKAAEGLKGKRPLAP